VHQEECQGSDVLQCVLFLEGCPAFCRCALPCAKMFQISNLLSFSAIN